MIVRVCAMALAAALTGCASGYGGGYDYYPGETYYDDPYYGGGFGYGSFYDGYDHDDYDRYFHPSRNVTCDRARDICYDRYGPSYDATARYLGEREANRAYKKYGDSVFRSDRATPDSLKRRAPGNMGSVGSGFDDDDDPVRRVAPTRRSIDDDDDDAVTRRIAPREDAKPQRLKPQRLADDDDVVRPTRRAQTEKPDTRQPLNPSGDKVRDGGAGKACPPKGCTD